MLLRFDFTYTSENDFFEYLLCLYAKNLNFSLEKSQEIITLKVQGNEKAINEFCASLENMPNSVFVRDFKVQALENESIEQSQIRKNFAKKDFLTSLNSRAYQEKGELIDNEWGEFVNDELCFDGASFEPISRANFNALLDESVSRLCAGQSFFVKNELGVYEIELFKGEWQKDFLMATDINAIKSAFVCSNENLKLLASLEKPLIKLRFSAIFRSKYQLEFNEFRLKLPHNLFFFALGKKLFEKNVNFLAFAKRQNLGFDFEIYELDKRLIVLNGLSFINQKARELILSKDDKNMARISYILSRFDERALLLELSQNDDDILLVDKGANLLRLDLPHNAKQLYADICADEVGARLFENFKQNFKLLSGEFKVKNNFFSLLGLVGQMLGLDDETQKAAHKLLELSDNSKLPRGVKIDFRFKENSKEFDYTRTLRSTMSFMLAGVEASNIAYGAVESLVYFLRDFYDELREKGLAECAIISGSLFECKSLTKNTLKHLKNCKVSDVPLFI